MSAGRRSCWRAERTWSALLTGQCAPGGVIKSRCLKFRIHSILLIFRDIPSSQQALQNYYQFCINKHINEIRLFQRALGRKTKRSWLGRWLCHKEKAAGVFAVLALEGFRNWSYANLCEIEKHIVTIGMSRKGTTTYSVLTIPSTLLYWVPVSLVEWAEMIKNFLSFCYPWSSYPFAFTRPKVYTCLTLWILQKHFNKARWKEDLILVKFSLYNPYNYQLDNAGPF